MYKCPTRSQNLVADYIQVNRMYCDFVIVKLCQIFIETFSLLLALKRLKMQNFLLNILKNFITQDEGCYVVIAKKNKHLKPRMHHNGAILHHYRLAIVFDCLTFMECVLLTEPFIKLGKFLYVCCKWKCVCLSHVKSERRQGNLILKLRTNMSVQNVIQLIKENEVKFVDLRT